MTSDFVCFCIARFRNAYRINNQKGLFKKNCQNERSYILLVLLAIILIKNSFVKALPDNFHISLLTNSTFSKSFEKINVLDYQYGKVMSNMTIYAKTINKEDSAILKVEKSNAEISTSVSNLININNEDLFVSKNDFSVDYIFPSSTILSQFPNLQINSTKSEKIVNCNYFINSPNLSYNWVNVQSYRATAKYSFLTFVLKQNVNGVFYLIYRVENNELSEVNINSESYDLNSEKYIRIWFIEQKYIDNDFIVLAGEKGNDFELIVLTIKINDIFDQNLKIELGLYTKIQIKAYFFWQINKIGFYNDEFIFATKKSGLVILHKFASQFDPQSNSTFQNMTINNVDNYLNNDPVWTTKTTINNFGNSYNNSLNLIKEDIPDEIKNNKYKDSSFKRKNKDPRDLQSNSTINSSIINNYTDVINTNVSMNSTPSNNANQTIPNNIPLINVNVLDIIINELTIYLIIEKRGLFIINLENFQISEEFKYENPYVYKLEFYNNIFLGNKFIGVFSENPKSTSQELFVELLIDRELNPIANKVFTSNLYIGHGKAASYDDLFTIILNITEKKFILIRKGMLNPIPVTTHILDISNYIKFDLENSDFISLYDILNKKVIYSLYKLDLVIPFNITFVDEFINCKFSQSGIFELNFIQRSELCNDSLNSKGSVSFCERNIKYMIEVVGPPSSDVQQIVTGVIIAFSIILIGLIIFLVIKTDGCRNIKYFKIIKTSQIRERLYYDAGQDINIEGNKQREILSQKIVMDNQLSINKDNKDLTQNEKKEKLSAMPTSRSFKFIFNPDFKKIDSNPEIKAAIDEDNFDEELRIYNKAENNFKGLNEVVNKDVLKDNKKENIFNCNESFKEKLKEEKHKHDNFQENVSQDNQNNILKSSDDKFPVLVCEDLKKDFIDEGNPKESVLDNSIKNNNISSKDILN